MGSVDPGPFYLGSGTPGGVTDQDLELLLLAQREADAPLLTGSAGMAGGRPHLQSVLFAKVLLARLKRRSRVRPKERPADAVRAERDAR